MIKMLQVARVGIGLENMMPRLPSIWQDIAT